MKDTLSGAKAVPEDWMAAGVTGELWAAVMGGREAVDRAQERKTEAENAAKLAYDKAMADAARTHEADLRAVGPTITLLLQPGRAFTIGELAELETATNVEERKAASKALEAVVRRDVVEMALANPDLTVRAAAMGAGWRTGRSVRGIIAIQAALVFEREKAKRVAAGVKFT